MTKRLKKLADDGIHLLVEHWRERALNAEADAKELRESLQGVVDVADRKTDEFDRARRALSRSSAGTLQ